MKHGRKEQIWDYYHFALEKKMSPSEDIEFINVKAFLRGALEL